MTKDTFAASGSSFDGQYSDKKKFRVYKCLTRRKVWQEFPTMRSALDCQCFIDSFLCRVVGLSS